MPRYEMKEGTSSKFWEITLDGSSFTTRWGRIGTDGQEKTQTFDTSWDARREFQKLIAEKEKKGYKRARPKNEGPQPKSNPELEAAILKEPDNTDAYLVYGDWLQAQGDARGELIALQHAALRARGAQASALKKKVSQLLEKHQGLLLGAVLRPLLDAGALSLEWHLGFIRSARVAARYETDQELPVPDALEVLLEHPSACFLRELTVGLAGSDGQNEYGPIIRVIAKRAPKTVQLIFIGDFDYPDETEISWANVGDVSPLYKALPGLRSLRLCGGAVKLGKVDLPELREFIVETGGLPRGAVKSIASAHWPKLERLEVWFGSEEYGAEGDVDDIRPILDARGLPNLKHLGLCNAEFTDALCKALPKSKVLPQLKTLDLSRGTMTDEGAEVLAANAAAFQHLEHLDVTQNLLSSRGQRQVAKLCADVAKGSQRDDEIDEEDDRRYVAVGE